jgi:hypothetical protein
VQLYDALVRNPPAVRQASEKFAERVAVLAYFAIPQADIWNATSSIETTQQKGGKNETRISPVALPAAGN